MKVIICGNYSELSIKAADIMEKLIRAKPAIVLGLATGSTPLGLYKELIKRNKEGIISFKKCRSFNLDEYVGLSSGDAQSYRYFMEKNLFDHIDIEKSNTFVPDGQASDIDAYCRWYEQKIQKAGGIDIQVLGLGGDGHIAFNEPGSAFDSRTRVQKLAPQTIEDNSRFFNSMDDVPRLAITMGIGTIMEARKILLLVSGAKKSLIVKKCLEAPVSEKYPASIIQKHPDAVVVLDREAASLLGGK
ncbi:MAG: glucosamine-6-phosphate deaminase [Candidatus Aureabacteria bacterium]|nr:glucosamine-6-phosphate deaminase [Candidatus Auribacterota bacterium]